MGETDIGGLLSEANLGQKQESLSKKINQSRKGL
jgi:hypothetical protein